MKIFEVGGCVRDELLGLESKDIDFTVVLDDTSLSVDEGWDKMLKWLRSEGFSLFLETKDCFTVRVKFPKGHKNEGLVVDFVMSRKEVGVIPGTRKPILELGTLEDDLMRRDFTVNSLCKDEDGKIIDLFEGVYDLTVQVQLPDEWKPELGRKNIGISAFVETDKCNPKWVKKCNEMDHVIVPSTFTA